MTQILDLKGEWSFLSDQEKAGLAAHYETQDFHDTIQLPTTVSEAKKGTPHEKVNTGYLTDPYEMSGYCWYRKTVQLPIESTAQLSGKHFELTMERTRISYVWVDGQFVGSFDSLIARHCYDLTPYIKTLSPVLTVMVSNTDYKVPGGHLTSPDTQTNWNGILGGIFLTIREDIRFGQIFAQSCPEEKRILLHFPVTNYGNAARSLRLDIRPALVRLRAEYLAPDAEISETLPLESLTEQTALTDAECHYDLSLQPGENPLSLSVDLTSCAALWDEEAPAVYRLDIEGGDRASVWCGLRSFTTDGTHFLINGRKTFLRGKHDGMIFPKTGYAPMHTAGWLHVMKIAKNYGINHYRFHTCCPPEAAFLAADLLGIYMQPELPFWGTFNGPEDEGYQQEAQEFLETEGFRMLEAFGSHPSYCMMSMGNELWGNAAAIDALLAKYKAFRPHILFTQGSNNFQWVPNIQPHDDFFSGVRFTIDRQIRGSYAMCDKPLGHVQTDAPGTRFQYDAAICPEYMSETEELSSDGTIEIQYGTGVKRVKLTEAQAELIPQIPVVSHEIGQYETYPDFREIERYTGVLKARNLSEFKRRLEEKEMLSFAEENFKNSGALAVACYKDELETALRSSRLAGFQLLDLQDFTGQGTALVGVLNSFMESKGLISAADWRKFCSDAVMQAEFDSYLVPAGQKFSFTVSLASFRKEPIPESTLRCFLKDSKGKVLAEFFRFVPAVTQQGRLLLGNFSLLIPNIAQPSCVSLTVSLSGTGISNSYTLWVYPKDFKEKALDTGRTFAASKNRAMLSIDGQKTLSVVRRLEGLAKAAKKHKSCLLFLSDEENKASVAGTYCTDFWCYHMFRMISLNMKKEVPVGTMGLSIDKAHEALRDFPCESFTTPQWYTIVNASRSSVLDGTEIRPIVRTIDNFDRNFRLGLLYELYVSDLDLGVLVCTADLPRLMREGHPESYALYESLTAYLPDLACRRAKCFSMTYAEFQSLLSAEIQEPEWE